MKKSFLYFVPAALILALLFVGCPTEADEDGGGGGSGPNGSYGSDLGSIARAFADADGGAKTVYVTDNIHIGDGELVIPSNGTLDMTDKVTIDQIGYNAKLVVAGRINFNGARLYQVRWDSVPSAKIIASPDFVRENIDIIDATENPPTPPYSKAIVAYQDQILNFIQAGDLGSADWWETQIKGLQTLTGNQGNSNLIPIVFSGTIDQRIADAMEKYASGRRVYLIGNVTLDAQLVLNATPAWSPDVPPLPDPDPVPDPDSALFNVIDDADGSLLIGGQAKFDGAASSVQTAGGLTVLGPLVTVNDRRNSAVTKGTGQLIAYTVRAESGGAYFEGPVKLISSQPSNFGASTTFVSSFETEGRSIFGGITFGGTASINGPAEFGNKQVTGNPIYINSTITFTGDTYPDISKFKLGDSVPLIAYIVDYDTDDLDPAPEDEVKFEKPVQFSKNARFGTQAVFEKGVTFDGNAVFSFPAAEKGVAYFQGDEALFRKNVTFNGNAAGSYSAAKVTFAETVNLGTAMIPEITSAVTFNKDVTFGTEGVTFSKPATFAGNVNGLTGDVSFSDVASFGGDVNGLDGDTWFAKGASFSGGVTFPAAKQVAFGGEGLKFHGGKIVIEPKISTGTLAVPEDADLAVKDGKITVAGTLTVGSASINVSGGGQIVLGTKPGTGLLFGTRGYAASTLNGNDYVYVETSSYEITGGSVGGGTLVGISGTLTGLTNNAEIVLDNSGISIGADSAGTQASLVFAGTHTTTGGAVAAPTLKLSNNIVIDGVTLDMGGLTDSVITGGKAAIGTIAANNGGVVITLKGTGSVNPTGGSAVTSGKAGAIRVGGTVLVFGNQVTTTLNAATPISDGYIVFNSSKNLVEGTGSVAYSAEIAGTSAGGSIAQLNVSGSNPYITLVTGGDDKGFVTAGSSTFYPVYGPADVVGIVTSVSPKKYVPFSSTGGSIAVFSGTLAAN